MFKQHQEAITEKQEEIFRSNESSIMQLISGNTAQTSETLDNLSREIEDLQEFLELTEEQTKGKFNTLNEKIITIERSLFSLKKDI